MVTIATLSDGYIVDAAFGWACSAPWAVRVGGGVSRRFRLVETLVFSAAALVALDVLALRFGADSRCLDARHQEGWWGCSEVSVGGRVTGAGRRRGPSVIASPTRAGHPARASSGDARRAGRWRSALASGRG